MNDEEKDIPEDETIDGEILDDEIELPEGLVGELEEDQEETDKDYSPEDRIAELEAEVTQYKDQYVRAHAEMENIRRRAEQEISNKSKFAVQDFAKSLLSVSDNLDRALSSVPQEARENDEATKNLIVGVDMTRAELMTVFERFNITPVEAEGRIFDPNFHQAMMEMEDPSVPAGTIVQVMQGGYVMHGRLLRPAMVSIAKGGPKPGAENAEAGQAIDEKA